MNDPKRSPLREAWSVLEIIQSVLIIAAIFIGVILVAKHLVGGLG